MFQTLSLYVPVTFDHCQVCAHLYNNMHASSFMLWHCKLSRKACYYFYYRKLVNPSAEVSTQFARTSYIFTAKQAINYSAVYRYFTPAWPISTFLVFTSTLRHQLQFSICCWYDQPNWCMKWKGSYRRWICVDETGWIAIIGKELSTPQQLPHLETILWKQIQ